MMKINSTKISKILFISCVLPFALFLSTVSAQELRTYPIPQRSEQEFNELLISAQKKEVRGLEELAWEHFFGINIPISVDEAMKIVNLPSLQNSAQALTIKGWIQLYMPDYQDEEQG